MQDGIDPKLCKSRVSRTTGPSLECIKIDKKEYVWNKFCSGLLDFISHVSETVQLGLASGINNL